MTFRIHSGAQETFIIIIIIIIIINNTFVLLNTLVHFKVSLPKDTFIFKNKQKILLTPNFWTVGFYIIIYLFIFTHLKKNVLIKEYF